MSLSEISATLRKELEKKGVEFKLESKVEEIGKSTVTYNDGSNSQEIEGDLVLVATGRRPNVVDYALRTNNPIGVQLYNRFGTGLKVISFGGCDRYRSKDKAQQDFLAKGGPKRDVFGLDPDGDGFACGWDPRPFRLAVAN